MRTIQMILIFLVLLFIACEDDKTTTPVEADYIIEDPEPAKLNVYPILGYMETGGDLVPKIDGRATDLIWQDKYSPPYEIVTRGGKDGFAPTVTMKALYDNWYLYLLISWEDETKSLQKNTWWVGEPDPQKHSIINVFDSTFTYYSPADTIYSETDTLHMPEDTVSVNKKVRSSVQTDWTVIDKLFTAVIEIVTYKVDIIVDSIRTPPTIEYLDGGTSTEYDTIIISGDEDGLAIFWNNNSSNVSCSEFCHGNSMAAGFNEILDVWHWRAQMTNAFQPKNFDDIEEYLGYADDKFLTNAGLHGDAGDSTCIINSDGLLPLYMDYHNSSNTGFNPNYLLDSMWVAIFPFTDQLNWQATNTLPGYIRHKPTGSRDDVRAKGGYSEGKWTLEIKRRLSTYSDLAETVFDDTDNQFNPNSDTDIEFLISVFDNAHGQDHATSADVHKIHFLQFKE